MSAVAGDLRERIRAVPGLDRLLPALQGLPPAFLVGGAVRDLLLGASSIDLDVAVEGDAVASAHRLSRRLAGEVTVHERFGTATVRADSLTLDLATTRRERYPEPGALPEVEPAGLAEDLERRDFTINAMAAGLTGEDLGHLHDPVNGRRDLDGATVRVLHDRSFVDDPTRLLRAVRYEARLDFAMDPDTEKLARDAAAAGAPGTVSGARIRDELLDLLAEPAAPSGLARLAELGIDTALHPHLDVDPELAASSALGAAETRADPVLSTLAALVSRSPATLTGWLDDLALRADQRDRAARAARRGPELVTELLTEERASRLYELMHSEPPETLALALASGAPAEPVLRWVRDLSGVRLEVSGDDLIAAGVPESPAIGRALGETLRRKLDGDVSGREAELELALSLAREGR
jgi:tRNA nucleotidyltransferase (CCA-adding enzyme)